MTGLCKATALKAIDPGLIIRTRISNEKWDIQIKNQTNRISKFILKFPKVFWRTNHGIPQNSNPIRNCLIFQSVLKPTYEIWSINGKKFSYSWLLLRYFKSRMLFLNISNIKISNKSKPTRLKFFSAFVLCYVILICK